MSFQYNRWHDSYTHLLIILTLTAKKKSFMDYWNNFTFSILIRCDLLNYSIYSYTPTTADRFSPINLHLKNAENKSFFHYTSFQMPSIFIFTFSFPKGFFSSALSKCTESLNHAAVQSLSYALLILCIWNISKMRTFPKLQKASHKHWNSMGYLCPLHIYIFIFIYLFVCLFCYLKTIDFSLYSPRKINHAKSPWTFTLKCELVIHYSNIKSVLLLKSFRINKTYFWEWSVVSSSNKYSKLYNVYKYADEKKQYILPTAFSHS